MAAASEVSSEQDLEIGSTIRSWPRLVTGGVVGLFLITVFVLCLNPIAVTDFWWQAKTGELIVQSGRIPHHDVFSWTARGNPWLVHEWLTEVLFFGLTRLPDWCLLLYKCGLGVVACGLVLLRAWRRSGSVSLALAVALFSAMALRNYADLRPQMVTYALLAGLLLGLDAHREGRMPRLPWVLPGVFMLWANLHGGVVVGVLLLGLWAVGDLIQRHLEREPLGPAIDLLKGAGFSLLAILVNPNGWEVYTYPFQVLGHPQVQDYITEWLSPNLHSWEMRSFEILLLLTCAALGVGRWSDGRRRIGLGELLVLLAMGHAALVAQRNTAPFGLAAAPAIAAGFSGFAEAQGAKLLAEMRRDPIIRCAAQAAVGVVMVALLCWFRPQAPLGQWTAHGIAMAQFPQSAAPRLEAGEWPGRIYNDYVWGGYLIWKAPSRPVFIDGRAEVYYPNKVFEDEMTIHHAAEGWEDVLDRRGVDVVLTASSDSLAAALSRSSAWTEAYRGPVESVFTRRPKSTESQP